MKIKLIAFDVNGTLFNDTDIFWGAINGIFEHFDKLSLPIKVLQKRFGQPWTKIYREEGISENMATDEELYKIYNKLYSRQQAADPFSGVKSTLSLLVQRGLILAIVSTQQNQITIPLLEKYGLDGLFYKVSGNISNKTEALKDVAKAADISPSEMAYVGDQTGDMDSAKKAGCVSIAFAGGLHERERLENSNPDFIIDSMSELKTLSIF